jgi:uncharacterized metal-binding protein
VVRVRVVPILLACRGCDKDRLAREMALVLDRRGLGEADVAGAHPDKARSRYPVYVIEGCAEACGGRWLAALGVQPARSFVLDPARAVQSQIESLCSCFGC